MKIIGNITKEMYYNQNPKFISYTDLQMYEIPQKTLCGVDIGRLIFLDEQTGEIQIESYSKKANRERKTYFLEAEENRPVINDTTNLPH